ncbi:hypothetical protein SB5439_05001 [Klebsiella variicola]|uniref:hypothetical protein n=1 Tax=Klebsiella variicola TaxID=244366 RepID=UPI00109C5FCA|nr:hypothetical protein [Klebsiella variicola]VGQ11835.1 hypothetical protein SB5439_05001 [Klebsiella variicola]
MITPDKAQECVNLATYLDSWAGVGSMWLILICCFHNVLSKGFNESLFDRLYNWLIILVIGAALMKVADGGYPFVSIKTFISLHGFFFAWRIIDKRFFRPRRK